MSTLTPPWDLRIPIDGTSFANRAAENDEFALNAIPSLGSSLALLVGSGAKITYGNTNVAMGGLALNTANVNPAFATTLLYAVATCYWPGGGAPTCFAQVGPNFTNVSLDLTVQSTGGAIAGAIPVLWIAIGL